jgi:transcriptional regulator with XRE-family HTH domain
VGSRIGIVVRTARVARGWTQLQLAQRLHCSASTVSRLETGARQTVDVPTLWRLADALQISPAALGITATVADEPGAEDDVRRRQLLGNLAVTAATAALQGRTVAAGNAQPAVSMVARTRDAMLGIGTVGPLLPPRRLRTTLVDAINDYDACRYEQLADALPQLIRSGHAVGGSADQVLAETYNLVARLMVKLADEQLGWVAADRARALAARCGASLAEAEAVRNLAVLARRAGWHSQAVEIAIGAAEGDTLRGNDPALGAERGLLLMSAAYTAAHAGDRAGMRELTAQAGAIAAELGGRMLLRDHGGGFGPAAVQLHLISAEYTAGDPAAAIAAARRISPRALPTTERRARYFTDVARAYGMWGRRSECVAALLVATRAAPEETLARPAIRDLVSRLLASGRTSPELRRLALRYGIT